MIAGKLWTLLLAAGAALLAWAFWPAPQMAPAVTFSMTDGAVVQSTTLRGNPVLVSFWSVSCEICLRDMPLLTHIQETTRDHGLQIIGVSMSYDPPPAVMASLEKLQPGYRTALDVSGEIASAFGGVRVTPTHFLINPRGEIVLSSEGPLDEIRLRAKLATFPVRS